MEFTNSLEFARKQDDNDVLSSFKKEFNFPVREGKKLIYFCGNSLGLQPKKTKDYIIEELTNWSERGVEGHVLGKKPWIDYHKFSKDSLGRLLGAEEHEVVCMNNLTTNLHLMLASFYQPKGNRNKILIEKGAFPSDHFAVESFMRMKGINPSDGMALIEIPEDGYLSNDKICDHITSIGDELSLVLLPGIQYYTGQFFDMKSISAKAHEVGAIAGYDLAHVIGNLPMHLHDDDVDFAVWCTYKYLNSGPGNVSGVFIHEKYSLNKDVPRLTGWWGHDESTRFQMKDVFDPAPSVDGWQLSNGNILGTAAHLAALDLFDQAGIDRLREKSIRLTGFLEFLIQDSAIISERLKIITPANYEERGCQLSLKFARAGKEVFDDLIKQGIIVDWRQPDVIRVAPAPLYNTFEEVFQFVHQLEKIIK